MGLILECSAEDWPPMLTLLIELNRLSHVACPLTHRRSRTKRMRFFVTGYQPTFPVKLNWTAWGVPFAMFLRSPPDANMPSRETENHCLTK